MNEISIAKRLQHKMLLLSHDVALQTVLRQALPEDWEMNVTLDLAELGNFDQLLLYRFIFLDLDSPDMRFDPQGAICKVRTEWMLNVPIFCFGGSDIARSEARLNRADRFFERDEAPARLLQFCQQFCW